MTQQQILPATEDQPIDLEALERRASAALNGYSADENITCYVYGRDVLALVRYVRRLEGQLKEVRK